jgi:hypothetical protein
MGIVLVIAVGLAGLRDPNELWASAIFTAVLAALLVATIGAIVRRGDRPFLVGFSLSGWVYLLVAFEFTNRFVAPDWSDQVYIEWPPMLTSRLLATAVGQMHREQIAAARPGMVGQNPGNNPVLMGFYQIGQTLLALLVALAGGMIGRAFAGHGETSGAMLKTEALP